MKKIVLDFLCKKVRLMDEDYTIGGLILVFVGTIFFVLLCGFLEYLGNL